MLFKIRTLTPIWTGNVEGKCNKLRETSILGSLRWWFEVIVRGFGSNACDPTSKNKKEKCSYQSDERDLCAVCKLFGTTGWAKRFRLELKQSFREVYEGKLIIKDSNKGWHYQSGLISCDGEVNIIRNMLPIRIRRENRVVDVNLDNIIGTLLRFISEWGMIGGKTAIGYGVVKFELKYKDEPRININEKDFFDYLDAKKTHGKNAENAPKLSEMFFAKFKFKESCIEKMITKIKGHINKQFPRTLYRCNGAHEKLNNADNLLKKLEDYYGFIPVSALIRKELRKRIRNELSNNHELRHFLMGKLGKFSAIQVSHVYKKEDKDWELRMWGWIPKNTKNIDKNSKKKREQIIKFIEGVLNDENFWNESIGCVPISDKNKIIVEYPNNNWNFIDFGQLGDEEIRKAFIDMLKGDQNE